MLGAKTKCVPEKIAAFKGAIRETKRLGKQAELHMQINIRYSIEFQKPKWEEVRGSCFSPTSVVAILFI